jgi:uncharacterized Zn-binding protein involved in type VI secretion
MAEDITSGESTEESSEEDSFDSGSTGFAVARVGDPVNTGHLCDSTTRILEGSSDVFIEGKPAAYSGSLLENHLILEVDKCVPHLNQKVESGSSKVFVNKKPLARVTDPADFGFITRGAQTVFAG